MNENHCHPQDGQIKLSQERKDEVWLQVGKLYLNVCAHCFSGKHSKEIRNFKCNIVSWYLCASWSPALLLSLTVIHISPHLDHINFIPERNTWEDNFSSGLIILNSHFLIPEREMWKTSDENWEFRPAGDLCF